MFAVHGRKIILLVLLWPVLHTQAQNLPQYDNRVLHFGFSLFGTRQSLNLNTSPEFYANPGTDTLLNIRQVPFSGFGLGAIVDLRIGQQFNLRSLGPQISFAQRNLLYEFKDKTKNKKAEIESVYLNFPVQIKYKSERHWNTRFYVIAGLCYTYDLTSEVDAPRSYADPVVALNKNMFSYEIGFGMDLYLPFFKLAPELKFSRSINNMLVKDDFIYTKSLSSLFPRTFTLSFHFE